MGERRTLLIDHVNCHAHFAVAGAAVEAAVDFEVAVFFRGEEEIIEGADRHFGVEVKGLDAEGVGDVVGGEMKLVGLTFAQRDFGGFVGEFFRVDFDDRGLYVLVFGADGADACDGQDEEDSNGGGVSALGHEEWCPVNE